MRKKAKARIREAVEGLKEQGFPVYVGMWMPCPVCKTPWKFHKANRKEEGKAPILLCPVYEEFVTVKSSPKS